MDGVLRWGRTGAGEAGGDVGEEARGDVSTLRFSGKGGGVPSSLARRGVFLSFAALSLSLSPLALSLPALFNTTCTYRAPHFSPFFCTETITQTPDGNDRKPNETHSQDIEIEVERFDQARSAALKDLRGFGPRPRASASEQVALAVDALARLSCGLPDGAPLDGEDARLLEAIVPPALAVARRYSSVAEGKTNSADVSSAAGASSVEDAVELVRAAVASRADRAKAYE